MKNTIKKYIAPVICSVILAITVSSCSKDNYYKDGGVVDPKFNGTILQYLQSHSKFDTIARIVKIAGMEDIFSKENITFFAPTDEVVRRTIGIVNGNIPLLQGGLNQTLFDLKKDTIKKLEDISPAIWRKYLMRYVFKGKFLLKDYPQLDFSLRPLYPGGYYYGYNGDLANIGVVFNTVNTVKYAGYRQLTIQIVVDPSNPSNYYFGAAPVASSDIQPTNGVIHVLAEWVPGTTDLGDIRLNPTTMNVFGMYYDFGTDVILSK
ncbi:fasciclin domain-containing protein [Mucilaginibacter sp. UR6-11]|uniref:fasciclin domain-containing protein n=1 Tax=Mucilaginibacter sp. UR6-11 TaxID=1435644 RepID=UPI001E3DD15D|nr:fasciclin domain-containing protein [Mucilaginibacter sp. UR6-11]MCC8424884.1 fasciclin domain-containing protein [Mucilaginibacter sp. UR6-11]